MRHSSAMMNKCHVTDISWDHNQLVQMNSFMHVPCHQMGWSCRCNYVLYAWTVCLILKSSTQPMMSISAHWILWKCFYIFKSNSFCPIFIKFTTSVLQTMPIWWIWPFLQPNQNRWCTHQTGNEVIAAWCIDTKCGAWTLGTIIVMSCHVNIFYCCHLAFFQKSEKEIQQPEMLFNLHQIWHREDLNSKPKESKGVSIGCEAAKQKVNSYLGQSLVSKIWNLLWVLTILPLWHDDKVTMATALCWRAWSLSSLLAV